MADGGRHSSTRPLKKRNSRPDTLEETAYFPHDVLAQADCADQCDAPGHRPEPGRTAKHAGRCNGGGSWPRGLSRRKYLPAPSTVRVMSPSTTHTELTRSHQETQGQLDMWRKGACACFAASRLACVFAKGHCPISGAHRGRGLATRRNRHEPRRSHRGPGAGPGG